MGKLVGWMTGAKFGQGKQQDAPPPANPDPAASGDTSIPGGMNNQAPPAPIAANAPGQKAWEHPGVEMLKRIAANNGGQPDPAFGPLMQRYFE